MTKREKDTLLAAVEQVGRLVKRPPVSPPPSERTRQEAEEEARNERGGRTNETT